MAKKRMGIVVLGLTLGAAALASMALVGCEPPRNPPAPAQK